MDRDSGRLFEQLQLARHRQRKVIQQLQSDHARLLGDLADIRQERDAFRREAARVRRENAELRNSLEEALTKCRDFRREWATLTTDGSCMTDPDPRSNTASVTHEGQTDSSQTVKGTTTDTTTTKGKHGRSRAPTCSGSFLILST